ncbi:MAG: glycosyltransferase [Verrucomicrobiota bacterium]|jgi:glycosyltransferase involved in cell wall biosynthesis
MKTDLNVLFVNPGGAAYGSERSMLVLLRGRQFEAEVVCPGGGALERELQQLGVKVHPLEFGKYSVRQNPMWHIGFYRRFRRILKASKPDVVVINLGGNTPLVTLAAVRAGIPIIRLSRFEFKPPTRWLDRWCWLKAKVIICPSELVRQQVVSWAPRHFHSRVHHLYDPHVHVDISGSQKEIIKNELKLHGVKTIGYVGRLHPKKRIETLIRAVVEIRSRGGNVRLLVIGGHDGSAAGAAYERQLRDSTTELAANDAVQFLGYRNDVPVVMAACDVIVLPSETESLGMVLLEAWSLKVPTVASDVAGCREVTLASGGGLLCPVGDHRAMAELIWDLIMRPELSRKLGESGQAWVKANCDSRVYGGRFSTLLDSVRKHSRSDSHAN